MKPTMQYAVGVEGIRARLVEIERKFDQAKQDEMTASRLQVWLSGQHVALTQLLTELQSAKRQAEETSGVPGHTTKETSEADPPAGSDAVQPT